MNFLIFWTWMSLFCQICNAWSWWFRRDAYCDTYDSDRARKTAVNLTSTLNKFVFGQHVVNAIVPNILKKHLLKENPKKALVLSFHGYSGTGKNYVNKFIAKAIFPDAGLKNPHFHMIISSIHFPIPSQNYEYKAKLQQWIKGNITICSRSVFVFDEIDKMPPHVIDGIKPFLDFHEDVDSIDCRKAIFIFISNTGGKKINEEVYKYLSEGKKREDITYGDLESLVSRGAFNEEGGLKKRSTYACVLKKNSVIEMNIYLKVK
ncbi:torsin-1B isoform X2 [Lepeophtheirus salmonis]|uniref:torsin-1B isoform X2 n=1 Tax=Lepeophtheirus salmonis TaxID=72036 RepID=UPI001AEA47BF|nr:torsin-1B-like isoform X1 [Lepeophtheirus salmonis]